MTEITADDLVIYKDGDKGVYSGGYSIDSILLKAGLPAITSIHYGGGGADTAAVTRDAGRSTGLSCKMNRPEGEMDDRPTTLAVTHSLFQDLVVPNWAFTSGANNPFVTAFGIGGGPAAAAGAHLPPSPTNIINDIVSDAPGETLYDKLLELASDKPSKPSGLKSPADDAENPRPIEKSRRKKSAAAAAAAPTAKTRKHKNKPVAAASAKTRKNRHMR